jgi:hypothetical protein
MRRSLFLAANACLGIALLVAALFASPPTAFAQTSVEWVQVGGPFRVKAATAGTASNPLCVHGLRCTCPGAGSYCGQHRNGAEVEFWKDGCNRPAITIKCVIRTAGPGPQPGASASNSGCPAPGSVRSDNSAQRASLEFQNRSGRRVDIFWLDYNGGRKHYKTLNPGQNYTQSTFATHPWIAVDPSGRCIGGVFRANSGRNTFQIM